MFTKKFWVCVSLVSPGRNEKKKQTSINLFVSLFSVLWMEPRPLNMLDNCSATEPHSQPLGIYNSKSVQDVSIVHQDGEPLGKWYVDRISPHQIICLHPSLHQGPVRILLFSAQTSAPLGSLPKSSHCGTLALVPSLKSALHGTPICSQAYTQSTTSRSLFPQAKT